KELWRRDLGEQRHIWGSGASPVIAGDRVFLNFGPGPKAAMVCMDKRSGKVLWKHDEPGGASGEPPPGGGKAEWNGSWGDPLLRHVGDREELIMTWPGRLCAADPASGRELWTCSGLNPLIYTSPVFADGIAVAMGGFNGSAIAVKAGGNGDVTSTR